MRPWNEREMWICAKTLRPSVYGHLFVGVDLPVLVGSVFGRSWEFLALDSVPDLADV
jgi:hypothetical protein